MIGNSVIMELIANGTLWYYESYDHKAAIEELKLVNPQFYNDFASSSNEYVPYEFKQNNIVWRIGKLRSMKFDPDCITSRMYIGRSFKFAKGFFPYHVGKTVKPILNINSDKLGLIKAGLGVDESPLNL